MAQIKHIIYRYHLIIFAALLGCISYLHFVVGLFDSSVFLSLGGGLGAFVYFVQKQQLEELRLFRELFREFNERYYRMNEGLNRIIEVSTDETLTPGEKDQLYKYFSLCGEEYLYFKRGYIGPDVWRAWRNGMETVFKNKRVCELWQDETKSNSYYGLERENLCQTL